MRTSTTLHRFVNEDVEKGDRVRIIDGSGIKSLVTDEEVYIVSAYPNLTGRGEVLKDLIGVVEVTGVVGIYTAYDSYLESAYSPDIIVRLENGLFYTCSDFVRKV